MATKITTLSSKIKSYTNALLGVRIARIFFFVYAFLSFLFWCLNCFEVDWIYSFEKLFILPYIILHNFYQPKGVSADFSLAIIGGISLILGFACEFVSNFLIHKVDEMQDELQKQIELKRRKRNRRKEATMQSVNDINGIQQGIPAVIEDPKLIFIILPHVNKIKRKETDLELTFQEVDTWKQRVNKRFIENIIYSKPMQKGYYRKNLFLVYKEFNYVDEFIYYFRPTLDTIILEFKKYGIIVSFCYVLSALSNMQDLEKELDCMDTILSLNFVNDIIVTNRFKINYENKGIQKYQIQFRGEYNLSKNLAISNKQSLYMLLDKRKGTALNENENN